MNCIFCQSKMSVSKRKYWICHTCPQQHNVDVYFVPVGGDFVLEFDYNNTSYHLRINTYDPVVWSLQKINEKFDALARSLGQQMNSNSDSIKCPFTPANVKTRLPFYLTFL